MLKPLLALTAGLWLSNLHAAAAVAVPLTPGLTVTTALLEPGRGDYESTKRLEARQGAGWRITYRAAFPPGRAAGGTERVDSLRLQSDADLQKATTYRQMFETGVEEDYPGTTALGASTLVLRQLKQQGKILHFGVSNFLPHQVSLLQQYVPIEYNQLEISILNLQPFINGELDYCLQHNIVPMAWSPLGGGIMNDHTHPRYRAIAACASELEAKYYTGINELLIAFLLAHPSGIIPVLGTTKVERLLQAKEARKIELEREDWFKLYTASLGEDVP